MQTIKYKTLSGVKESLHIVKTHFASRFAFPYAIEYCKGFGYDIGPGKREWCLPGAIPIDFTVPLNKQEKEIIKLHTVKSVSTIIDKPWWNATTLPETEGGVDFIFSSHCLEHLDNPYRTVEYWHKKLRTGGILFLYLPDYSNYYWRPWHNHKHIHVITPEIMKDFLTDTGFGNIFVSGTDLNDSFMIISQKI